MSETTTAHDATAIRQSLEVALALIAHAARYQSEFVNGLTLRVQSHIEDALRLLHDVPREPSADLRRLREFLSEKMLESQRRHSDADTQPAIVMWSGRQIALDQVISEVDRLLASSAPPTTQYTSPLSAVGCDGQSLIDAAKRYPVDQFAQDVAPSPSSPPPASPKEQ